MARTSRLTDVQTQNALGSVPCWELRDGKLAREFKFEDFGGAWAFMTRVALLAEKLDHHPEWFNVWNTVRIGLSTHEVGGLSDLDFELAKRIDAIVAGATYE